ELQYVALRVRTRPPCLSALIIYRYGDPPGLHSFPTRRSSDLPLQLAYATVSTARAKQSLFQGGPLSSPWRAGCVPGARGRSRWVPISAPPAGKTCVNGHLSRRPRSHHGVGPVGASTSTSSRTA